MFFFFPFGSALATDNLDVVINEIAWMGTENSVNDEWIELYNNSSSDLDLKGWKLMNESGKLIIELEGEITKESFFLLERTDDQTVPDINADLIYKGSLNNEGQYLKLADQDNKIIDEINCSSGWFAGDNKTKRTMERKNSLESGNYSQNWQTSQNSSGTPKLKNSSVSERLSEDGPRIAEEEEIKTTEDSSPLTVSQPEINYPNGVIFNEILPSPEGPDDQNEWIEFFNQNDFEVNLFNWKIKDASGKITTYIFPKETIIKAGGFLVTYRPETKITLNNEGDNLILLQPDEEITDEISYQKAPQKQSFNRFDQDWVWSSNLTPGDVNIINTTSLSQKKTEESKTPYSAKIEQETGAISKKIPENKDYLSVLLIASIVAFLSGTIILILKRFLINS